MIDFRSPENKKILLIIVAAAVLLYIDIAYILKAQLNAFGSLRPQITKIRSDLKTLETEISRSRALEQKSGEPVQAKKFLLESQLDSLLQDISNTAAKYNVNIISIHKRPHKEPAPAKTRPAKFAAYMISLNLSSDYNGLGKFINDLESSANFMAVTNLAISAGKTDLYTQDAALTLMTYVVK